MLEVLKDSEYVVLDLETTWLTPYREWITEIAAIKCRDW
jgi:DNA polymerase III alpha subunit (gram-positive type)